MLVVNRKRKTYGRGVLNYLIDHLPVELHWPGTSFCGPGTKLEERLKRGDKGIHPLDEACKRHDIAYFNSSDLDTRHKADEQLKETAWERFKAKDSSIGEKAAAYVVTNAMKAKLAMGAGVKSRKGSEKKTTSGVDRKKSVIASSSVRKGAGVKKNKKKKKTSKKTGSGTRKISKKQLPRVIPLPKNGGFMEYLSPILTGLSHVGSVAGSAHGLLKNLKKVKEGGGGKRRMKLAPFKKGWGLYLKPYEPKNC